jgi:hypothetical protein
MVDLGDEADNATEMLRGRSVRAVHRHRDRELVVEFEDGTRLLVDSQTALELSITGGLEE